MPFTPLHMGPGIIVKLLLQGSFSLMVFGWSQIMMDIQPLLVMITGEGHLHGFSHTYLGATLLAIFSAVSGKYLAEFGLRLLRIFNDESSALTWRVTMLSAFIGTFSHVLLDSLMHSDLQPFFPFITDNPFVGTISIGALNRFCIYSAGIGGVLFFGVNYLRDRNNLWGV